MEIPIEVFALLFFGSITIMLIGLLKQLGVALAIAGMLIIVLSLLTDTIILGYSEPQIDSVTDLTDTTPVSGLVTIETHNYSNSTGWTQINQDGGADKIEITGGALSYTGSAGGSNNNRQTMHRAISETLSNTHWQINGKLRWTSQTGGGAFFVYAVSENTSWLNDGSSNDMIGLIYSFSATGRLAISVKDGTTATTSSFISSISSSTDYYWRLERLDATTTKLSVFSDSARTTHVSGSPIAFTVPSGITALDTIQHSNNFGDGTGNLFTGTVDDVTILTEKDTMVTNVIGQSYTYIDAEPNTFLFTEWHKIFLMLIGAFMMILAPVVVFMKDK